MAHVVLMIYSEYFETFSFLLRFVFVVKIILGLGFGGKDHLIKQILIQKLFCRNISVDHAILLRILL
jgi:hypothetical protein